MAFGGISTTSTTCSTTRTSLRVAMCNRPGGWSSGCSPKSDEVRVQDATGRDATLPQQLLAELEAARFIARASATLAELVDYESTLERISSLAVPTFADWFGVHIRESGGGIRRLAVRHSDPAMQALVVEMYRLYPPGQPPTYGAPRVIETGEPLFVPQLAAVIAQSARDATHAQMLAALQLRSFICVPMRSRHGIVGAL